jgi:PAS domain S-box-containing protein
VRLRTAELTAANEKLTEEVDRRVSAQEMLQRNYDVQNITGEVLRLSMESMTLQEYLEYTLDLILSVKWLSLDGKGSIFLTDDSGAAAASGGPAAESGVRTPELVMKAQRGLAEVLLGRCRKIPFGTCLCGRAAQERSVVFADRLDERHDVKYPGIPPHGHYCVPIMSGGKVLGVINMYVKEGHKRDPIEENFITAVANTLGGAIERKRIEDELARNLDILDITGKVLQLSMEPITLEEQLVRTLDLILCVKWLSLDGKGSIFLADENSSELVMKAQRGLSEVLLGKCMKIPFGTCLCGRAALERKVVFADRIDERHDVMYPNIPPHGHYCVPIMSGAKVLGVINMYVKEGHKREPVEEDFITSVANTLSGTIERKRIEDELLSFNELLHTLIDNIPDSIYFKDMNNRFVMINKAKAQHSKTDLKEIIGKTDYDFMPEEQARQSFMDDQMVKNTGKSIKGKIEKISRRDGGDVWVSVVKLPWRDKNGTMVGTMGISRDITTLKNTEESLRKKERQLAYLAHHDALTGLPNRLLFDDRMKQTIAYARRYKQLFAVMFLDLDKFKHINDTLGHDCGDDLLRTVAGRLIRCVRESDTVARMGGDEFMILLIDAAGVYDGDTGGSPIDGGSAAASNSGSATASKGGSAAASNSPTPIEAGLRPENREAGEGNAPHHSPIEGFEIVARKIIAAVEEGFLLAGERHFITTSVGVSLFPQDGDDAEILVKKADIALYNAKESGRNNYKFYSPNMENNTSRNMDKMS